MVTAFNNKYVWKPWRINSFKLFEKEKSSIELALQEVDHNIYFFGSSSIPGVGGKGFIDIYISSSNKEVCKEQLIKIGYEFRENAGNENRLFLQRYFKDNNDLLAYHIHITNHSNYNLIQSIAFRDFLRENKEYAKKYSDIKKMASIAAIKQSNKQDSKEVYMKTKTPVIDVIMVEVEKYIKKNSVKYKNL